MFIRKIVIQHAGTLSCLGSVVADCMDEKNFGEMSVKDVQPKFTWYIFIINMAHATQQTEADKKAYLADEAKSLRDQGFVNFRIITEDEIIKDI